MYIGTMLSIIFSFSSTKEITTPYFKAGKQNIVSRLHETLSYQNIITSSDGSKSHHNTPMDRLFGRFTSTKDSRSKINEQAKNERTT